MCGAYMSGEAETTEMPETYFWRNQNVLASAETSPETLVSVYDQN